MTKTIQLEIITPTKVFDEGQVDYVRAPSLDGLFGVQNRHAPAIIAMKTGEIKVVKEGKTKYFSTAGGFADIRPENVQLLVETAERGEEIDKERAQVSLERAQEILKVEDANHARARSALERSQNRLKVADLSKHIIQ